MIIKKIKEEKAITVTSLVIVIILLLIIASIAITTFSSSTTIIEKATTSVSAYKYEELKEKVKLKLMNLNIEKLSEGNNATLQDVLNLKNSDDEIVDAYQSNNTVILLIDNHECVIDENLETQSITKYNPAKIKRVTRRITYFNK